MRYDYETYGFEQNHRCGGERPSGRWQQQWPAEVDELDAGLGGWAVKVFVSAVAGGYVEFRQAAKDAIDALGHEPVVMELTHHAAAAYPTEECFAQIEGSDVVVMLLGGRYGESQQSGKSATHEEWGHACRYNKPILPFVEDLDDHAERDPQQQDFLDETGGWEEGSYWGRTIRCRFGCSDSTPSIA